MLTWSSLFLKNSHIFHFTFREWNNFFSTSIRMIVCNYHSKPLDMQIFSPEHSILSPVPLCFFFFSLYVPICCPQIGKFPYPHYTRILVVNFYINFCLGIYVQVVMLPFQNVCCDFCVELFSVSKCCDSYNFTLPAKHQQRESQGHSFLVWNLAILL